jgi:hypothetical protein
MKIETAADLAAAKNMGFAPDQLAELEIGCEIWDVRGENGFGQSWTGTMCRWPNGRGAFESGSDSDWGDWEGDTLLIDDTDPDVRRYIDSNGNEVEVTEVKTTGNSFVHQAHGWEFSLSAPDGTTGKAFLTVTSQKYELDPGAGQNLVVSAFFRACEFLDFDKAGELYHSGGYVRCEVLPESKDWSISE